jgi:hypothetical protein
MIRVAKRAARPIFLFTHGEAPGCFAITRTRDMKLAVYAGTIAIVAASTMGMAQAEPGGCLKYGAVGAVGGHFAGHHAVLGAAGGCALGMYKRHEYKKHLKQEMQVPAGSHQ